MNFQGEIYIDFLEDVQDRNESTREVIEALLKESLGWWAERHSTHARYSSR